MIGKTYVEGDLMDEWHIGDPVDWGDGWMDAQNWGRRDDDENKKSPKTRPKYSGSAEYSKRAWDCYLDYDYDSALYYINRALDLNNRNANNWNRKAIILEHLGRYAESEKCYNKSLELGPHNLVYDNKARMLYDWADNLLAESKKIPNGLAKLEEALEKNRLATETLPGDDSEEDIERYLNQKRAIESAIKAEKEYLRNVERLKSYNKNELFTIVGMKFYNVDFNHSQGMPLRLIREPDNEHDRDAIAVYAENNKVGYVANNSYTKSELTSSASQLKDRIGDVADAEFLCILYKSTEFQFYNKEFYIGRII